MKIGREAALGMLLLLVVAVLMVAVGMRLNSAPLPALTTYSTQLDGAMALKLWLEQLEVPLVEAVPAGYDVPDEAALAFLLQPLEFGSGELDAVEEWVRAGGTLVAAGDSVGMVALAGRFDVSYRYLNALAEETRLQTPLLDSPSFQEPFHLQTYLGFQVERTDFVTLAAAGGMPQVILFDLEQGRVILSASAFPFCNDGLRQEGNPALVLNLVAAARRSGAAWFDEWHHGFREAPQIIGPDRWLRYTPFGHALLFVVALAFLALLLQGRNFGRPVPLPRELRRRSALEYITAVANLNRRAGHRSAVLQQYYQQVKRALGRRYRLDPALEDAEFVAALVRYNPAIDGPALASLLTRLRRSGGREADLVRLADEAARWLEG